MPESEATIMSNLESQLDDDLHFSLSLDISAVEHAKQQELRRGPEPFAAGLRSASNSKE